ncbi:MAG: hypothetical protein WBP95_10870, partial [Acidobacteriaceae bacterium]
MLGGYLILSLFLCAPLAGAQSRRSSAALPDSPAPASYLLRQPAPAPQSQPTPASHPTDPGTPADAAPDLTMFPHSQTARWWMSGQTNTIFQAKPGFHSPYQGP